MRQKKEGEIQIIGTKINENPKGTGGKYIDAPLSFNLRQETEVGGMGKPITVEAAKSMIIDYWEDKIKKTDEIENLEKESFAFIVGKEALLRILTQDGCEGIRFYMCANSDENFKNSLVLAGINSKKEDLAVLGLGSQIQTLVDPGLNPEQIPEPIELYEKVGRISLGDYIEGGPKENHTDPLMRIAKQLQTNFLNK